LTRATHSNEDGCAWAVSVPQEIGTCAQLPRSFRELVSTARAPSAVTSSPNVRGSCAFTPSHDHPPAPPTHSAGFDVIGVDINPQPNYPYRFVQADWRSALDETGWDPWDFDVIHASPPCQGYTAMSNRWRGKGGKADDHLRLIHEVRTELARLRLPYVIENVVGARAAMRNPILLNGGMFGLRVDRPRLFESNVLLLQPDRVQVRDSVGVYGKRPDGRRLWTRADGTEQRAAASVEEAREAMGMPWASWRGCAEAIPPAYTEHIGNQLMDHLRRSAA